MSRVAVFGGTAEGRMLAQRLAASGVTVCVFVATAYGEALIEPQIGLSVRQGRLDRGEMASVFKNESFDAVADATHPYAAQVTENLFYASKEAGVLYLRVTHARSTRNNTADDGVITVESFEAAAELLDRMNGRILLTIGSKNLETFTRISGFESRLFARVLPGVEIAQKCEEIGFNNRNLICMQGPFTHEMNVAIIKMLGIGIVVTKDSGAAGGFHEKLAAALECASRLIVIRRPNHIMDIENISVEAALNILTSRLKPQNLSERKPCPRFPIFIPLEGKNVLVIGGGKVAARRARVILDFGAAVTVVSPKISTELRELLGSIDWKPERYRNIEGNFVLVIAATDDRSVNRLIGADAKRMGIFVSVADSMEESTFWFPAIAKGGGIVAGIVSDNGNHGAVKKAAEKIRKGLEENL